MRLGRDGLGLPDGPASTTGSPSREQARDSAARWLPGDYDVVPNGVLDSAARPTPATASTAIVFVGRHEPRKGLQVLLRAWPDDPSPRPARGCG